ncbi:hypothetical protein SCLCIDRAFT_1213879 [Scleroderma citrinum Foug A]|uniref:Secreted protein n=1 Tax=Scleroderma citrinum Foug A TaxID=1036808 RepID=A0A0C2ZR60_9AGAM|nr:hypothetical protein SCLCIDRAFT_1213879 [Scleroderma citrinum Foug A]
MATVVVVTMSILVWKVIHAATVDAATAVITVASSGTVYAVRMGSCALTIGMVKLRANLRGIQSWFLRAVLVWFWGSNL